MGPLLRMQTRLHFEDLPENEQVQYLQKIAQMRRKYTSVPNSVSHYLDMFYFLHEVQFSAAIEAAHFPDLQIDAMQQSREGAPFMGTALAG